MSKAMILDSNLILRSVRDQAEAERWALFNGKYNNPQEGEICACLVRHHPHMPLEYFWLVEDTATGEIVSTTCLIPWKAQFCGIELRLAQLEMVLTHPVYRGRGLVRQQMDNFHRVVKEGGYDISIIWGIPFYYRQFGYTYTLDGQASETLAAWQISDPEPDSTTFKVRAAALEDMPMIKMLSDAQNAPLDLCITRDQAIWNYLLLHARRPYEVIANPHDGSLLGYACTHRRDGRAAILESGIPDPTTALAYLRWLKSQSPQGVIVGGPASDTLSQAARSLGSARSIESQWLVRIPDVAVLLTKLAPVFNARLEKAGYHAFNDQLTINLYRHAYRLSFADTHLSGVDDLEFVDYSMGADGGDLCIPPDAFTRLLTGYRSLEQLRDAWPDIVLKSQAQQLVDVLFPTITGYLYTPYAPLAGM